MICVICLFEKVMKVVAGGSVINRATPSSFMSLYTMFGSICISAAKFYFERIALMSVI